MARDFSTPRHTNKSVWEGTTPAMVKEEYGHEYHPFAEHGRLGESKIESDGILVLFVNADSKLAYFSCGPIGEGFGQ